MLDATRRRRAIRSGIAVGLAFGFGFIVGEGLSTTRHREVCAGTGGIEPVWFSVTTKEVRCKRCFTPSGAE